MGGRPKTSTLDATRFVPPSRCLRSKMGTASEASPTLSGHLTVRMLVIVLRCCSTYLNNVASPHEVTQRLLARVTLDLSSLVVITSNYVHMVNHLMVILIAHLGQMNVAITSLS
jgi:hypothetical protein